jgi:CRISPR-associated endonuclease Cas1/group II intron reverse transcriptase/maturase
VAPVPADSKALPPPSGLADLRWYRLRAELVNQRRSQVSRAHAFSVCQAMVKAVCSRLAGGESETAVELPVFFHLAGRRHTAGVNEGDRLRLEVFFCESAAKTHAPVSVDLAFARKWREGFAAYLAEAEAGKNYALAELGDVEERSLSAVSSELGTVNCEGELVLDFLSPLPFKPEPGRARTGITKEQFIRAFESRFSHLFGRPLDYAPGDDNFELLPCYWDYTQIQHSSKSQPGEVQFLNGCVGRLYLKGRYANFLPFLLLGAELHTGRRLPNSQGYYRLHAEPVPHYGPRLADKGAVLTALRSVLERYDHALETLSVEDGLAFNEEQYAEKISREIAAGQYVFSPHKAFAIQKKSGGRRVVEQPALRDLAVQQHLLKLVGEDFEKMLSAESLGYRKGLSRDTAAARIRAAIADGYEYVAESDIQDFFPSVDHAVLGCLLDGLIPEGDAGLKALLRQAYTCGYILDGELRARACGLAQGSPLSPLLANLYLDSFDKAVKKSAGADEVRFIRYADDFILLARTREQAEQVLADGEAALAGLGLRLNKEKTAVKSISEEGFNFLGFTFPVREAAGNSEACGGAKKPLYVTEPFLFLSLDGEAVSARKSGRVLDTVPFRNISEILVMNKASFSTALLSKCVEERVPLTVTLNSGYYVTTIKPDSKDYYAVAFEHARRYAALSDTERLCIAKEFVSGKLRNYAALFRQRYERGSYLYLGELSRAAEAALEADSIDRLRGVEGAAARAVYRQLDQLIENPAFRLTSRQRRNPDRINSLLNYGHYLMFSRINATVRALGLNPYLGFLHAPEDSYESFVCDLQELFRARVDRFILRLINLHIITERDFEETERGCYMHGDAIRRFLLEFEAEMDKKVRGKELSLKESLYAQAVVFKRWATSDGSLSFYRWVA